VSLSTSGLQHSWHAFQADFSECFICFRDLRRRQSHAARRSDRASFITGEIVRVDGDLIVQRLSEPLSDQYGKRGGLSADYAASIASFSGQNKAK
jgi:hypothetical protein